MPETFFAYHAVTERPMPPRICLDEGRPNGVRARVEAQRGIVEDIWANPEKYREEELRHWAEYFDRLGRQVFGVVKLKITGVFFAGDAAKCFDGTADEAENRRLAERYWENRTDPRDEPPIVELLAAGEMEIVEEDTLWKK